MLVAGPRLAQGGQHLGGGLPLLGEHPQHPLLDLGQLHGLGMA